LDIQIAARNLGSGGRSRLGGVDGERLKDKSF